MSWRSRADGRTAYGSVYGDGVFAKRVNPDRRIVVIDLPSKSLTRIIDLGAVYAPHGVMMDERGTLWSSGELGNAVLAIDPATDKVETIDVGHTAHWVAVSHATGKVFASVKSDYRGGHRCGAPRCDRPHRAAARGRGARGLARRRDGLLLPRRTPPSSTSSMRARHAVTRTVPIDGANPDKKQMRRVRVSPDNDYVVVSSNQDHHAAIYRAAALKQIASFPTKKSPMGFGFAPGGTHAYLCCHDDAEVFEFELATGRVTRTFPTAAGCEFIVAYH